MKVCVAPYVRVFVQEVEAVLIDSDNTGGIKGGGAAAVDVEEGGAEHGEGTDQPCVHKDTRQEGAHTVTVLFFKEGPGGLDKH